MIPTIFSIFFYSWFHLLKLRCDGEMVERFEPSVAPDDPGLIAAIEKALG